MRHFCRITGMLCHIFFMFWYIFFFFMFWHILLLDPDIGNLNQKNVIFGKKIWSFLVQKKIYSFCPSKLNWFTSCHCSDVYFTTSDVLPHLILGFISQCLTCLCESLFTEDRQVRYRSYEISVKVQIWKSWSQSERKENKRKKIGPNFDNQRILDFLRTGSKVFFCSTY